MKDQDDYDEIGVRYTLRSLPIFDDADETNKQNPKPILHFRRPHKATPDTDVDGCIKRYSKPAFQYSIHILDKWEMRERRQFYEDHGSGPGPGEKEVKKVEALRAIDNDMMQGSVELPIIGGRQSRPSIEESASDQSLLARSSSKEQKADFNKSLKFLKAKYTQNSPTNSATSTRKSPRKLRCFHEYSCTRACGQDTQQSSLLTGEVRHWLSATPSWKPCVRRTHIPEM
jgi:hypothetical protein